MDVEDGVLEFFHEELSIVTTWKLRHVPLEMDDILQEYADEGELVDAIAAYGEKFQLDVTRIHWANYYPWRRDSAIRRWLFRQPFLQTKKRSQPECLPTPPKPAAGCMIKGPSAP